ncbi:MAG TPA: SCP2 sterol-binding domain-containing protein [Roseovarius sp.]
MTHPTEQIPHFPVALALPMRLLPLAPLSISLTAYARSVARRHPGLFRRLGAYDHATFVLDPADLPFVICLDANGGQPRVAVRRGRGTGEARIAGPLAALLGLVHGAFDGDALFFSRDLVVEGDTSAALALRNAIDDAELDLSREITQVSGPFAAPLQWVIAVLERRSGFSLTRAMETQTW